MCPMYLHTISYWLMSGPTCNADITGSFVFQIFFRNFCVENGSVLWELIHNL